MTPSFGRSRLFVLLVLLFLLTITRFIHAADSITDARTCLSKKEFEQACKICQKLLESDKNNPQLYELLGHSFAGLRQHDRAIGAYDEAIRLDPKSWETYDRRGDARLKSGLWKDAIQDFDLYLKHDPKAAPEHWRRGIALYYAARYEDGVKQFDTHKTVNPQDVENAAWHYLCNRHVVGKVKALESLIDVTRDRRVPMAEIQKLFAGRLKPEEVLAVAEKTKADTQAGKSARCYAHLYVALWYESENKADKTLEHLTLVVDKYQIPDYMWDVANAHLKMLKAKKTPGK